MNGANSQPPYNVPKRVRFASHAIVSFQNDYSTTTPVIEVATVALATLVDQVDRSRLQAINLDIEGAENALIWYTLREGMCLPQLCVEFDQLGVPTTMTR